MAELRLTGPTEDGRALRLSDPEGSEHLLPLTPYLRRLVLEDAASEADGAAAEGQEPEAAPGGAAREHAAPENAAPAEPSADTAAGDGEPDAEAEDADTAAEPDAAEESGPSPLAPRISVAPAAEDAPAEITRADDAARTPARVTAVAGQEDVRAAATAEAVPLAPREIQARIRAGATVEQVARESGNSYARIRTYGHPVLAERGWVAQQARSAQIWVGGPDLYSSTVADGGPSTLGELAAHRLAELGADPASLEWDAWRRPEGTWTVSASFPLPARSDLPTREEPPARWTFRPAGGHLDPQNAWARVLSDAEAWDVFSAEPVPEAAEDAAPAPEDVRSAGDEDAGELLDILRARRGRRVGQDDASDDALAYLIARGAAARAARSSAPGEARTAEPVPAPAADPGASDESATRESASAGPDEVPAAPSPAAEPMAPRSRAARLLQGLPAAAEPEEDVETVAAAAAPFGQDAAPQPDPTPAAPGEPTTVEMEGPDADGRGPDSAATDRTEPAAVEEEPAPAPRPARPAMPTPRPRARSASRRASVPSWDDIVFGRKGD